MGQIKDNGERKVEGEERGNEYNEVGVPEGTTRNSSVCGPDSGYQQVPYSRGPSPTVTSCFGSGTRQEVRYSGPNPNGDESSF